jgi:calcium binding protein
MAKVKEDPRRERRINEEILVEAYSADEQALAWHNYLDRHLHFPFLAHCRAERLISPLRKGDEIEVVGLAPEEECHCEMFVTMRWENRELAVPLAQLEPGHSDKPTRQAVEDWLYWVRRGYEFSDLS